MHIIKPPCIGLPHGNWHNFCIFLLQNLPITQQAPFPYTTCSTRIFPLETRRKTIVPPIPFIQLRDKTFTVLEKEIFNRTISRGCVARRAVSHHNHPLHLGDFCSHHPQSIGKFDHIMRRDYRSQGSILDGSRQRIHECFQFLGSRLIQFGDLLGRLLSDPMIGIPSPDILPDGNQFITQLLHLEACTVDSTI